LDVVCGNVGVWISRRNGRGKHCILLFRAIRGEWSTSDKRRHHMTDIVALADLSTGLGINTFAFLSQLISFGVVFFILWRWGFPAITKILDERQAVIREGVENAQRAKRELTEATSRAEQVLLDARRDAQQTTERAAKVAQDEARRIEEEARERAE